MEKYIHKIIDDIEDIKPIGNHHLKRHYVYHVLTNDGEYIIKFYGVNNRYESELNCLKLLEDKGLPVPRVLKHGVIDSREYIVMTHLDGVLMSDVALEMDDLKKLYESAGNYLRKINDIQEKQFGRLVRSLQYEHYEDYFNYELSRITYHLKQYDHPNQKIIDQGLDLINRHLPVVCFKKGLCHMDYGSRNILVKKENGEYIISGIIDFEQAAITDVKREMSLLYAKYLNDNNTAAFFKGYGTTYEPDDIYTLYYGLSICGWALPVDKMHYQEGEDIIRKVVEKYDDRSIK